MIFRFPGVGSPLLLARRDGWYKVYLQVVGPATVRISQKRETLLLTSGGLTQGITLSSADGLVSLDWKGSLWGISDTPDATMIVEVVG